MGANFSMANLGQRKANDFYETPYSMTQQFLDVSEWDKAQTILEPAYGNGAIVKILEANGFEDIIFKDIRSKEHFGHFLLEKGSFPQMITNPPYSLTDEFILKAKQVVTKQFAMLLPLNKLQGKHRYDVIYSDRQFPLKSVHVFTRFPLLGDELRNDGKYNTGMMVMAWYTWQKAYKGNPYIAWIDNNDFVLTAKERID